MRKIAVFIIVIAFLAGTIPAFAAEGGQKGASARAFERASDKAIFHRVSDWFATIGKSKEEKQAIIEEREAERAAKRAEKELKKRQKMTEKETEKAQKKIRKQTQKAKRGYAEE